MGKVLFSAHPTAPLLSSTVLFNAVLLTAGHTELPCTALLPNITTVTISVGGEGGVGLLSKAHMTSFMDGP